MTTKEERETIRQAANAIKSNARGIRHAMKELPVGTSVTGAGYLDECDKAVRVLTSRQMCTTEERYTVACHVLRVLRSL